MGIVVVTPAAHEVVSTENVKEFARIEHTAEDTLIEELIKAAEDLVQRATDIQLLTATYDMTLDRWPVVNDPIAIPFDPVTSITHIKYIDPDGVEQTLASSVYGLDLGVKPAEIYLEHNEEWPDLRDERNAITVRFVAGYANAAAVPDLLKTAVKITVTYWLENREEGCTELPAAAHNICNRYRYRFST